MSKSEQEFKTPGKAEPLTTTTMCEGSHKNLSAVIAKKQLTPGLREQRGRIELIMGCMFAGKTTELLRRCRKHQICGKRVLRIKFVSDVRYGNEGAISTHTGEKCDAITVQHLMEVPVDHWGSFEVIGIDEGQFFTDLVEFSEMAANSGKVVIISSLQGTFLRGPFPSILSLIPKAEKIKKLSAICKLCKENASFTFRTASSSCDKLIGGDDMYMPLCRSCHARETSNNPNNHFFGDPTVISVDVEAKKPEDAKPEQEKAPQVITSSAPIMGEASVGAGKDLSTEAMTLSQRSEQADKHTSARDLLTI